MEPDINYFGKNRQLFPRRQKYAANRLICGHLNRMKFNHNIETYLRNRKQKVSRAKSLARAATCQCNRIENDPSTRAKIQLMFQSIEQRKQLSNKLEKVTIQIKETENQGEKNNIEKSNEFQIYTKSLKRLYGIDTHKSIQYS